MTINRARIRDCIPELGLATPQEIRSGLRRALAILESDMKTPQLRNAKELRQERKARLSHSNQSSHDIAMRRAIEGIETAQRDGKTHYNDLTFPDSVVKELRAENYIVTYNHACGMGDMDSHTISW